MSGADTFPTRFPVPGDDGLHRPVSATPDDEGDFRVCGTCGTDLYGLGVCPDTPMAACGCPEYMVVDGEHLPGFHD